MAKKSKERESDEPIVDVVESYSKTQQYVEENQQLLSIIGIALVVIIGGYFGFTRLYLAPLEDEAQQQMWKAQQYFEKDSLDLAIYGDGNYFGFETIIDEYGMTESANLAHYYLGVIHYKKGEYEIAVHHLNEFESDDVMVSSVAKGVLGDCYMDLGQVEEAVNYYVKAAMDDENEFTTPIYLMKAGKAYEELGNFKEAKKMYEKIKKKYPFTQEGRNIDKYIAKAEGKIS